MERRKEKRLEEVRERRGNVKGKRRKMRDEERGESGRKDEG